MIPVKKNIQTLRGMRKILIWFLWRVDSSLRIYSLSASDVRSYQQNCKCGKKHLYNAQIVYWNNDAKKGCEFLVKVSERYCPYHHYRCIHIKVSLTQVGQCGERQNSEEEIKLTDTVWLAKILQNQTPLPPLKPEHLNWI